MDSFFDGLGKRAADAVAKVKWTYSALAGTEEEALQAEGELGLQMASAFLEEVELVDDGQEAQALQSIGQKLSKCLTDRRRVFHFGCFHGMEAQAVAFPGGYIFLSEGLVRLCANYEDAFAAIIGHEIGHVIKNHAFERAMASQVVKILSMGSMVGGPVKRTLVSLVSRWLDKGYGDDQELEADIFAVRLAHAGGYHPAGLVRLLERLDESMLIGGYWESHPSPVKRARNLRKAF